MNRSNRRMIARTGVGTSAPVIRSTGASRKSKASLSTICAQISLPTPNAGKPPSTVTRLTHEDVSSRYGSRIITTYRLVFLTDLLMASMSRGRILRRLMTSALMPSLASASAASRLCVTILLCATIVTSLPSRSTLHFPIGRRKLSDMASVDMGNETPYNISFSRKTTGLGSRMADCILVSGGAHYIKRLRTLSRPLQSSALQGLTTLRPGTEPYQAA